MQSMISMIFSDKFLLAVVRSSTPLLFATLGAFVASRAGVVNIGIEGTMLAGALMGVVFSAYFHSAWIGLAGAVLSGVVLSLLMAYFILKLKNNTILTGIAINILSSGGTVFLLYILTGDKGISTSLKSAVFPSVHIPVIQSIPVIGKILSGHNLLTYVAILCLILIHILFNYTSLGLRIRAVGESPKAAESVGINVGRIQLISLIMSGILAAMGGAFLSMSYVSWFSSGMTSGRGYIALAARAIAGNSSLGTLGASVLFGFADTLANYFQVVSIPSEFVQMTPYIVTILGFIVISIVNDKNEIKRKKKSMS